MNPSPTTVSTVPVRTQARRGNHGFSWAATLRASQKIDWQVADLIGNGKTLDFARPFLPESFARSNALPFLTPRERLVHNHVRAHGYLGTFVLVEEFILPFVLDHVRKSLHADSVHSAANPGDDSRSRALLGFAEEEVKHMELFKRFREEFVRGFEARCEVIGPAAEIGAAVLAKPALSVALLVLQIEWMSQRHYLDSVADDTTLDPCFSSLLRHHWMEEAQHAKLDTLVVEELAAALSPAEIRAGIEGYFELIAFFEGGTAAQVELDVDALERAIGRKLSASERETYVRVQLPAMRWTYIGAGITHPRFVDSLTLIDPDACARAQAIAASYR